VEPLTSNNSTLTANKTPLQTGLNQFNLLAPVEE